MDKELLKQRVNAAIDEYAAKIKDIADRIYAGEIQDAKTVAAVMAYLAKNK